MHSGYSLPYAQNQKSTKIPRRRGWEMTMKRLIGTTATALLLAVSLNSGPADAGNGKGKGPRAGLAAATVCAVDGTNLEVTSRLTNISTGNAIPDVISSTYTGLAKVTTGNWGRQQFFDMANGDFTGLVFDTQDIHATLDLCELKNLGILEIAKAVNVMATINYDRDGGGDPKQIDNMCSDDPATDVVEPDGIGLTNAIVATIEAGCF